MGTFAQREKLIEAFSILGKSSSTRNFINILGKLEETKDLDLVMGYLTC